MGSPEPVKPAYPTSYPAYGGSSTRKRDEDGFYFDDYDEFGSYTPHDAKKAENDTFSLNRITIIMNVSNEKIGDIAIYHKAVYDPDKSKIRATEIVYDRLEQLLGKNYESHFTVGFDVYEGVDDYEVTVTLDPDQLTTATLF